MVAKGLIYWVTETRRVRLLEGTGECGDPEEKNQTKAEKVDGGLIRTGDPVRITFKGK